jgi:PAS domain-containing protein
MALETLFYHNRNLCWIFDLETHEFVAVNNKCVEIFGYDEDEFLQRLTIDQFFPSDFSFEQSKSAIIAFKNRKGETFDLCVFPQSARFNGRDCCFVEAMYPNELPAALYGQTDRSTMLFRA